jgi:hypothetical protein
MTDQIMSIAKQRGKAVAMLGVLGFIQTMFHPETAVAVWPALGLAFGALGAMEAYAARSTQ